MTRKQVSSLKLEERVDFGKFYVKKKGKGSYCLIDTTNKFRNRWGTLDQIMKDVDYALANDQLPPPSGERW